MEETKQIISRESAQAQIDSLLESYRLDFNDLEIENGPEAMKTVANRLTRAIMDGRLEIHSDGTCTQTLAYPPSDVNTITYGRLNWHAKNAYEKTKGSRTEGTVTLMAALGKVPEDGLKKLDPIDFSVLESLAILFLSA